MGTRLTKPKETVPGRRPKFPSMPIVISSDFILHIIPRLIGPVGKESLLNRIPSWPCRLQMLLQKGPLRANSAPHARHPLLLPHVVKVVTLRILFIPIMDTSGHTLFFFSIAHCCAHRDDGDSLVKKTPALRTSPPTICTPLLRVLCFKALCLCIGMGDILGYIRPVWARHIFFCWWLLGYVPGGAPFSQLSSGVKDAMAISTE